ncbi:MAG: YdcF family protein [Acidobacteria bacterium]|nr:YdcF family protein [Acidobacteriota bacterium]
MRPRTLALATFLLICVALLVPWSRTQFLLGVGAALVAQDTLAHADVIVIGPDVGEAGVLEAADLVAVGMGSHVAVLGVPTTMVSLEFRRRGLPYTDASTQLVALLHVLGVPNAEVLGPSANGTEEGAARLAEWSVRQNVRSIIVVTGPDHSRRFRRVLRRSLAGSGTRVMVTVSRYSAFTSARWWHQRGTLRTGLIELQKLLLDVLRHPLG